MSELVSPALSDRPALSQTERIVDTLVAPSKTFTDILRNGSWWAPFVLICILALVSSAVVGNKIGWDAVTQQQIMKSPRAAEQMAQLKPEDRASRLRLSAKVSQYVSYSVPVLILLISALCVVVLWMSINFGLGAQTSFNQIFAVWMYAGLPKLFITLLNIVFVLAGIGTESYDIKNPVGTNLGYYLSDAPAWLQGLGSWLDIFNLWGLYLLVLGVSVVAKKTKGQAAAVVVGWWVVCLLVAVGWTAAFGG
ncbi:MAG: YIP1 family protein [Acidobacteriaceae bacterium]|nr:YIP1 family protein [Acidobacteriaceae bacterium]